MKDQTTMVATLGGQPQVITFTLDLLLERGEQIDQVVIVYPSSSRRYQESYRRLVGEFAGDRYAGQTCHLRNIPIRIGDESITDARTPSEVEAVRKTFHELLANLKAQNQCIHLSLSGGRRVMALIALAAAMQHLTPVDCIWHIFTPDDLAESARDGAVMHVPPGSGLQLISVPFVPWAAYFPGLAPLLSSSPEDMREASLSWLSEAERECCRQVWDSLTIRQRDALRAFASGMDRQQAAGSLNISVSTLDDHRDVVIRRCKEVWNTEPKCDFDLYFLRDRFWPFLRGLGEV